MNLPRFITQKHFITQNGFGEVHGKRSFERNRQ